MGTEVTKNPEQIKNEGKLLLMIFNTKLFYINS